LPQARRAAPQPQQRQQQQQTPALAAPTREGSRWIGNPPASDEVAKWFKENVRLHDGLTHDHYIGGLVLIPGQEKVKRVNENGAIFEVQRLTHVPYVKVETRVAYWWDWIAAAFDGDAVGELVPVRARKAADGLPPGFFAYNPTDKAGKVVPHIGCSMQARVIERSVRTGVQGKVLFEAPPANKIIAVLNRYGDPDPFATMKAETGAIGRCLGMAGMLVIPGSGVATAEDMQEIATAQGGAQGEVEAALPTDDGDQGEVADAGDIRAKIAEHMVRLESEAPAKYQEFVAWAGERRVPLDDLKDHHLRGVLRQLERRLAEAAA
jgi:hypothetical protein